MLLCYINLELRYSPKNSFMIDFNLFLCLSIYFAIGLFVHIVSLVNNNVCKFVSVDNIAREPSTV